VKGDRNPYNLINVLPCADDIVDFTSGNTASSNMNGLPPINVKSSTGKVFQFAY
jgi:hypothetical protein